MEKQIFDKLLLKTAFACMTCDGEIAQQELDSIRAWGKESGIMNDSDIRTEIEEMVTDINRNGYRFLAGFLSELRSAELDEQQALSVIRTALQIIRADEKIEYSEVKFFKIIRSQLRLTNTAISAAIPDVESFLEQDLHSASYIERLKLDFFENFALPSFDVSQSFQEALIPGPGRP